MRMISIEVDEELFAFLQQHGEPLVDTPNDVLRRLLLQKGTQPTIRTEREAPISRGSRLRRSGTLQSLIQTGRISAGDRLRFERPRMHEVYEATVTNDGWIELPDGRSFSKPSPALGEQTGTTINGWQYIHVPSGLTLAALRDDLAEQSDLPA